jgi:hypothetical protein
VWEQEVLVKSALHLAPSLPRLLLLPTGRETKGEGGTLIAHACFVQGKQGRRTQVGTLTGNARVAKVTLVASPLHTQSSCLLISAIPEHWLRQG